MAFNINNKEFNSKEEFVQYGRGCATKIPTPIEILKVDEDIRQNEKRALRYESIVIQIKFHHLTLGSRGLITEKQRKEQVELLNSAFKDANVTFTYEEKNDVDYFDNRNWYYMNHNSFEEREAKTTLSLNTRKYLNFYTGGLESGLLGWATFPFDLAGDPKIDGVVVLDESMPGGSAKPYNLGMTGVHEVGHWLGLYHTFQDGCNGYGDHVHDTPAHSGPNSGTPDDSKPWNACKDDEFAPVHNYMNYVDDEWMTEITPAQSERIKKEIMMYRSGLLQMGSSRLI